MLNIYVAAMIPTPKPITFPSVLHQLRSLCLHLRYLRLTLRDRSIPIREYKASLTQIKHKLLLISQYLEAIAELVMVQFGQRRDRASRYHYQVLTNLIQSMQHLVTSLIHLTEEYFIDPIGVQLCLQYEIDTDVMEIQQRLNHLLPSEYQISSHQNSAA